MDAFHFIGYVLKSDNEEGENECLPSNFQILLKPVQNFEHEQDENAQYAVMEVMPHGFTGKSSFFMSICNL